MFRSALFVASALAMAAVAHAGPKPLKKPASTYKVGGKSVSNLDPDKLDELAEGAVKELGYKAAGAYVRGDYLWEAISTGITRTDAKYGDKTAEKYEVYFVRPAAKPEEGCDPKEATSPGKDSILTSEGLVYVLDKKADVLVAIKPSYDLYGLKTPAEQRSAMAKTAKTLFDAIYKK